MSQDVAVEFIRLVPSILWFLLLVILLFLFYKPIRNELLPKIRGFKGFGVEVTFVQEEIDKAARNRGFSIPVTELSMVSKRAERLAPVLNGSRVLWVDDRPELTAHEVGLLNRLGVSVDIATTSSEGLSLLSRREYDLVVSDIDRDGVADEGIRFLSTIRQRHYDSRVVFYIGDLDRDKGVPAYAFGITNRPDELMHLVFDGLERRRG